MILQNEIRTLIFRKEKFDVNYHFFLCKDSKEQFTNEELDEINLNQLYNQFRVAHNLPFPDEIISIREKYGLSASKMSEVFRFWNKIHIEIMKQVKYQMNQMQD
ncbi:MAG: hypothetical protein HC905_05940 [Bacteroidales bacterium]|nr:hypothetical protein [Bacteroidales bacterium]